MEQTQNKEIKRTVLDYDDIVGMAPFLKGRGVWSAG